MSNSVFVIFVLTWRPEVGDVLPPVFRVGVPEAEPVEVVLEVR